MTDQVSAWDLLHMGDAVRARVAKDRSTVSAVADDLGYSRSSTAKAAWLAGSYDSEARGRLSAKLLKSLTPMHLEVVAKLPDAERERLLRQADRDDLAARELRTIARATAGSDGPTATPNSLDASARALELYAGFDDRALQMLVDGPNGQKVRKIAAAGRRLSDRLTNFAA